MAALFGDVTLLEEDVLAELGIEEGFHARILRIRGPADEVVHCHLRTVGVVDFKSIAPAHQVVADGAEAVRRGAGKKRRRSKVTVNPVAHEVIGAEIADLQDGVGDGLSYRHEILSPLLAFSHSQAAELFLCLSHFGLETGAGLQTGEADRGCHARHVHVALPMRPGDDAAYAVVPGPGVQGVRRGGVDLGKQQRGCPSPHRVSGGVAAFAAQFRFLARKHLLVEYFEGPTAMVISFGRHAHLVRCGQAVHEHGPDGRGGFLRKGQAERDGKFIKQGLVRPNGIPLGHFGPRGVGALRLAPLILHDVVRKAVRQGIRRGGKALDQVRKLFRREIDLLGMARGRGQEQDGREEKKLFHSVIGFSGGRGTRRRR